MEGCNHILGRSWKFIYDLLKVYSPPPSLHPARQGLERAEMELLNPLICSSSQLSGQLVPPLYRAGTQGGHYLRSREFCEVMDSMRHAFLGAILDNG